MKLNKWTYRLVFWPAISSHCGYFMINLSQDQIIKIILISDCYQATVYTVETVVQYSTVQYKKWRRTERGTGLPTKDATSTTTVVFYFKQFCSSQKWNNYSMFAIFFTKIYTRPLKKIAPKHPQIWLICGVSGRHWSRILCG